MAPRCQLRPSAVPVAAFAALVLVAALSLVALPSFVPSLGAGIAEAAPRLSSSDGTYFTAPNRRSRPWYSSRQRRSS